MAKVTTEPQLSKAYNESIAKIKDFHTRTWTRTGLYAVLRSAATEPPLTDSERLLEGRLRREFERSGAAVRDEAQRAELQRLQARLSACCVDYLRNVNTDVSRVVVDTRDELEGMSDDYVSSLQRTESGGYVVTMKYPDVVPLMMLCRREATRRRVEFTFNNRCKDANLPLLHEILGLRHEIARILGFANHSSFALCVKMAQTPEAVERFQDDMQARLTPLAERELAQLLELKRQEKAERGEPFDGRINEWDMNYYINRLKERDFGVDDQKTREYFPLPVVTERMLGIYQQVLGLRFVQLETTPDNSWHPDVRLYQVFDGESDAPMGHFYLDLFPRDGKYSHACAYPVVDGFFVDGQWSPPIAVMVANFTKPTATKPSLLNHKEVITYAHEFGHVMHSICARAEHARFTWFHVPIDFVESPSQMLENWAWSRDVLKQLSAHYTDNSVPMPDDLVDSIVRSRNACVGITKLRQIFFGNYDMSIHSAAPPERPEELSALWARLKPQVMLIGATPDTNYPASFMHLCAGYDSGYYGYLWSEVFAQDLFSRFLNEGELNPTVGAAYRNKILRPGASREPADLLRDFLGRDPSPDSFLRSLGL